ncbi:dodecin family protein [Olivibacter sp. CPCC 100613]|uniref:dodecin family protein n=1 Tax=Olivibacter sp. CPCC 100613 TaxID=3079931 RepID=UPI002FFBB07F
MTLVKVIEVIASSEVSFDDAIKNAVKEVTETIENVDSVYVKDFKVHVKDRQITTFGAVCKVSFRIDEGKRNQSH